MNGIGLKGRDHISSLPTPHPPLAHCGVLCGQFDFADTALPTGSIFLAVRSRVSTPFHILG